MLENKMFNILYEKDKKLFIIIWLCFLMFNRLYKFFCIYKVIWEKFMD